MRHRLGKITATLVILLLATPLIAWAEEVEPGSTLTWSIVPADEDGVPDGRVSFRITADPGESITEHALVTNYSDVETTFTLLASDGVITADGTFDIVDPAEGPEGSGTWISVAPSVTVPAQGSSVVPFTITVPDDAVPGDHPAGITAGVSHDGAGDGGAAVGLNARVGARIHLRVAGELQVATALEGLRVEYQPSWNPFAPGQAVVTYSVLNSGNVRLQSSESLSLDTLFGRISRDVATPELAAREILPGAGKPVTVVVEDVWPLGPVAAQVVTEPSAVGDDDLGGALPAAAVASDSTWAVPWAQLVLVVLVVAAAVLWRRHRARRRRQYLTALEHARAEGAATASQHVGSTSV